MSDARKRAEEALAKWDAPEMAPPACHLCGKEMDCHYSGPDGMRWYCGDYFGGRESRDHFEKSVCFRSPANHAPNLANALRALLAEEPGGAQLVEREPGHESCVGCGRPVAPSEDQVREFAYYLGGDRAVAAIEAVPTPSPLPPEVREAAECTGIAASWCPVHGNCSCPRDEEGARTENRFGVDCPLHGLASNHGDAEVSALAARRGA